VPAFGQHDGFVAHEGGSPTALASVDDMQVVCIERDWKSAIAQLREEFRQARIIDIEDDKSARCADLSQQSFR
jgi:hypothetical protein